MTIGTHVAFSSWLELAFARGCDGADVFLGDVAQHVLFAQQLISQAFSLGTFETTHGRAERRAGARTIVIASNNESAILLAIDSSS